MGDSCANCRGKSCAHCYRRNQPVKAVGAVGVVAGSSVVMKGGGGVLMGEVVNLRPNFATTYAQAKTQLPAIQKEVQSQLAAMKTTCGEEGVLLAEETLILFQVIKRTDGFAVLDWVRTGDKEFIGAILLWLNKVAIVHRKYGLMCFFDMIDNISKSTFKATFCAPFKKMSGEARKLLRMFLSVLVVAEKALADVLFLMPDIMKDVAEVCQMKDVPVAEYRQMYNTVRVLMSKVGTLKPAKSKQEMEAEAEASAAACPVCVDCDKSCCADKKSYTDLAPFLIGGIVVGAALVAIASQ